MDSTALEKKQFHPLISIGVFVVLFLAIHPFQDGNGRLGIRDITSLTQANRNTIKKTLSLLVRQNQIVKNGIGKSTWYTLF